MISTEYHFDIQERYPKKSEYPPNTGSNPTLDMLVIKSICQKFILWLIN
jgi:hypothetical protein